MYAIPCATSNLPRNQFVNQSAPLRFRRGKSALMVGDIVSSAPSDKVAFVVVGSVPVSVMHFQGR